MSDPRLTDRFGRHLRDLRVSVIDRCNFRCGYCMPPDVYDEGYEFLPREEILDYEEITRLARVFGRLGVVKVRLTGGEPLLRRELEKLVRMLSSVEGIEDLAMTTNGYLLDRHARALAEAGLDRVTVSLDSLDPETFRRMVGRDWGLERVLEGIETAREAGLDPVKVNTVVQRGVNDDGLLELARRFRGTGVTLRFIEFMDVGTLNGWRMEAVVPSREILERIHAGHPLVPLDQRYPGEVADRYRYLDGGGEIGFVSSVTEPFCGDCTRARLSSEGTLYTCLFGSAGTDLKTPMREGADDEELEAIVRRVWSRRTDRYSELRRRETEPGPGVAGTAGEESGVRRRLEMFRIGG